MYVNYVLEGSMYRNMRGMCVKGWWGVCVRPSTCEGVVTILFHCILSRQRQQKILVVYLIGKISPQFKSSCSDYLRIRW